MAESNLRFENVMEPALVMSVSGSDSIMTTAELPSTFDWPADVNTEYAVQRDQPFTLGMRWKKTGPGAFDPNHKWRVEYIFEAQGAAEFELPLAQRVHWVNYGPVGGGTASWSHSVTLAPYDLPVGLYRVTGMLQLAGPGAPGTPIRQGVIGFANMGLLSVYED